MPTTTPSPDRVHPAASEYDLGVPPAVEMAKPDWFDDIPWHRCDERELDPDAIAALEYMDTIEGHVCAGYLHLALASPANRATTERTDFAAGWGIQENWHGIALHRFLDEYRGISVSTRARTQDARRADLSFAERHSQVIAGAAGSLAPEVYPAVYAAMGYRNEVMTLRGYGSLRSKVNIPHPHPVLDPLLRHLMRDEAQHARFYRKVATHHLGSNPRARHATRRAMRHWWGIVGENFAGTDGADRIILFLFRDEQDRNLVDKIDAEVASLPGLDGVRPMRRRLEEALARNPEP